MKSINKKEVVKVINDAKKLGIKITWATNSTPQNATTTTVATSLSQYLPGELPKEYTFFLNDTNEEFMTKVRKLKDILIGVEKHLEFLEPNNEILEIRHALDESPTII